MIPSKEGIFVFVFAFWSFQEFCRVFYITNIDQSSYFTISIANLLCPWVFVFGRVSDYSINDSAKMLKSV